MEIVEDAKMRVNDQKRVTYVRAFGVAPSPNSLATSAMFGMDGEATFSMDMSSLGMLAYLSTCLPLCVATVDMTLGPH